MPATLTSDPEQVPFSLVPVVDRIEAVVNDREYILTRMWHNHSNQGMMRAFYRDSGRLPSVFNPSANYEFADLRARLEAKGELFLQKVEDHGEGTSENPLMELVLNEMWFRFQVPGSFIAYVGLESLNADHHLYEDDKFEDDGVHTGFLTIMVPNLTPLPEIQAWASGLLEGLTPVDPESAHSAKISVLVGNASGNTALHQVEYQKPTVDVGLSYGSRFAGSIHPAVLEHLRAPKSGLILFHGAPGTGKSTYINYLTSEVKNKVFVYIPVGNVDALLNPTLVTMFLKEKSNLSKSKDGFVLVVEDAEKILTTSEAGRTAAISNLLNMSDGIIGAALQMQIVCTFNTKMAEVDKALVRKGRLLLQNEFGPLNRVDAQALLDHLGLKSQATGPMTLADIYGIEREQIVNSLPKTQLGFGS